MPSRPDTWSLEAIKRRWITVDPDRGEVYKITGQRAEMADKRTAYGRVQVLDKPLTLAFAHRVVWISVHGLIPYGMQVNHINRVRWDNRLANLELVAPLGNARHWRGRPDYDAIGAGDYALDPAWASDPQTVHRTDDVHQLVPELRSDGYARPLQARVYE